MGADIEEDRVGGENDEIGESAGIESGAWKEGGGDGDQSAVLLIFARGACL